MDIEAVENDVDEEEEAVEDDGSEDEEAVEDGRSKGQEAVEDDGGEDEEVESSRIFHCVGHMLRSDFSSCGLT